jgi:hypothetical protein
MPQPPQSSGSVVVSVHTLLHVISPVGHVQLPEMHDAPEGHTVPHPPQLLVSRVVSKQPAEPQAVSPVPHRHAVTPALVPQLEPGPQTIPHEPQLKLSVARFTQLPLHAVVPAGQPQLPLVQTPPSRHGWPHVPQSVALLEVFWQPSAHVTVPVGHVHAPV